MQSFIERNVLRLTKVNQTDAAAFVILWDAYLNGNFQASDKMKYVMSSFFYSCLEELQTGENFLGKFG
jgi:hypothetical protein